MTDEESYEINSRVPPRIPPVADPHFQLLCAFPSIVGHWSVHPRRLLRLHSVTRPTLRFAPVLAAFFAAWEPFLQSPLPKNCCYHPQLELQHLEYGGTEN